jgi:hypothetical protein
MLNTPSMASKIRGQKSSGVAVHLRAISSLRIPRPRHWHRYFHLRHQQLSKPQPSLNSQPPSAMGAGCPVQSALLKQLTMRQAAELAAIVALNRPLIILAAPHGPRQRLRTSARISSERCFLLNRRQRFSVNARIMSERCCGGSLSQTARRAWWPSF